MELLFFETYQKLLTNVRNLLQVCSLAHDKHIEYLNEIKLSSSNAERFTDKLLMGERFLLLLFNVLF